ncbi:MAG: SUMF1/EgtB/PvdO family nonheme iron enzyme [Planctomycetota bacterium]
MRSRRILVLTLIFSCRFVDGQVEFDWATVGDPGNAADGRIGSVDYEFRISKYEVTNEQYAEFLRKVASSDPHELFDERMGIRRTGSSGSFTYAAIRGRERHPVNYIRFTDAMRFVNWLENGQGDGGTEAGAYSVEDGSSESRSQDARFFIPSDNEWYKAAFYDPTLEGGAGGYWRWATRSEETPALEPPPGGVNSVNASGSGVRGTTEVGAYRGVTNYYGTFDQTGNVWEWTDEANLSLGFRRKRGTSWGSHVLMITLNHTPVDRHHAGGATGFRVAARAPETSFRRGDCNGDNKVDVSDAIFTLWTLFFEQGDPFCDDACDANDDGVVDLSDATVGLRALFLGEASIPPPGANDCGVDATQDELACELVDSCV